MKDRYIKLMTTVFIVFSLICHNFSVFAHNNVLNVSYDPCGVRFNGESIIVEAF